MNRIEHTHSGVPGGPGEFRGKPSPTPGFSPGLLEVEEFQLVEEAELSSAVGGPGHLPLTGGDVDVVGEAGGPLHDPHAPWGDTGDL